MSCLPWPPCPSTYLHDSHQRLPDSPGSLHEGHMEVHFLSLVLKYQDSSQEQASSSQQRHLFLSPTPTHTRGTAPTTPWEGTKFPPTTTPATGLHPSVQPVTACATPDSGRSLYFAHGVVSPDQALPVDSIRSPRATGSTSAPFFFSQTNPLPGTPREANAGGRSLTTLRGIARRASY